MSKTRLELTWIGKGQRPRLEPRILLEDPELSYHANERVTEDDTFDNRLIFGDNLLALKALEHEFGGKVKCIYIDPPYNTGQALEMYDDSLEHSIWLSMMRDRFEILYRLLSNDGMFWIHLDDSEVHYAKVLLDEIFGRAHFVADIAYERSGAAGLGLGGFVVTTGEHILLYRKGAFPSHRVKASQPLELKTMRRYNRVLISEGTRELVDEFTAKSNGLPVRLYRHSNIQIKTISLAKFEERQDSIFAEFASYFDKLFRTNQIQKENAFQRDLVGRMDKSRLYTVEYTPSRGKHEGSLTKLYYLNAELFAWLADTASLEEGAIVKQSSITNIWSNSEIPKADLQNEGGVDFPRSKKPEQLLKRIVEMSTERGDLVLDSFAGSGTTGAVAHKLGRRWIMVELGEHCTSHIRPRLLSIVDGKDARGITKASEWKGGGGFRFYKLAPSLLKRDKYGQWVINDAYNAEMLAEAMCKHMGFTYLPSDETYWQHGRSTETDFIYVTTQTFNAEAMAHLAEEVGPNRSLLVCCAAWTDNPGTFPNLTFTKIPNAVLNKCEFGKDDYSLQVQNLPMRAPEAPSEPEPVLSRKKRTEPTTGVLFDSSSDTETEGEG